MWHLNALYIVSINGNLDRKINFSFLSEDIFRYQLCQSMYQPIDTILDYPLS